ncbi:hypothetical protein ACROYT_G000869 [Oculina patagonica]
MDEELFSAIEAENYRLARELCLKGAKADQLQGGITALHLLSGQESKEASSILELCVKKLWCNPNVKSTEGLTPLHVAALWGRFYNLKILIDNGGDVKEMDEEGSNALDFAQEASCIRLLLEVESAADSRANEQVLHATINEEPTGLSIIKDSESDFSESFYTAVEGHSVLDQTVVTFPKLHPWHADPSQTSVLDDTVVDGFKHLSLSSYSFEENETLHESYSQGMSEQPCYHEQDSINEDPEFADTTIFYDWKECSTLLDQSANNSVIVSDSIRKLSDCDLKKQLQRYGENPGPIMAGTRNVYLKRLARLQSGATCSKDSQYAEYLPELRMHLEGRAATPDFFQAEESMCVEFDLKKNWREGTEKSSFNYLLIDPRVTQNLPSRAKKMSHEEVFKVFIMAVFYVGKGKRSRPYAHLNEALNSAKQSAKLQQIKDIWAAGLGVVSLHIFQSVIPVEAYRREACMIDALGLSRLTNKKRGDYYGRAQSWPTKKRREMGTTQARRSQNKAFLLDLRP